MTVKELIMILHRYPDEAIVTIREHSDIDDGMYDHDLEEQDIGFGGLNKINIETPQ